MKVGGLKHGLRVRVSHPPLNYNFCKDKNVAEVQVQSENVTVRSDVEDHLVAVVGVSNIEVIHTPNVTIVVNKASETLTEDLLKLAHELAKKIGE